jgi:hypothetical protein
MAKKKKKDLDIHIDTKNIDLDIVRKDGETKIKYDSKHVDVEVTKNDEKIDVKVVGDGVIGEKIAKGIRKIIKRRG